MKKIMTLLTISALFVGIFSFTVDAEAAQEVAASVVSASDVLQNEIKAKACALMDVNSGTLIAASNEHDKLYPASVTKIMTLLLVCEAIEQGKMTLGTVITCSDTAAAKGGSQIWLEPGEQMTVDELLKATVIYSANDACTLLGETVAGSETAFAALMNEKAASLGMNDTHFDNCTGLDDDTEVHKSSAYDVALMSCALLKHDLIKKYTTIWMDSLRDGKTQLVNTNKLVRYYSGATGLKTGTTSKAGCCVAASAERDGMEIVAVILGADNSNDRFSSARALLDWGFANYEIFKPVPDKTLLKEISVVHSKERFFVPECGEPEEILLRKGSGASVVQTAEFPDSMEAPVAQGQSVGKIVFRSGDEIIAQTDLFCSVEIEKLNLLSAWMMLFEAFSGK